jgi:hypothetical protein
MQPEAQTRDLRTLANKLFWTAVITLIVGLKLIVTFFAPSLRAPAEPLLGGFLLLVCTVQLYLLRAEVQRTGPGSPGAE